MVQDFFHQPYVSLPEGNLYFILNPKIHSVFQREHVDFGAGRHKKTGLQAVLFAYFVLNMFLGGGFKYFLNFHPYLGK